MPDQRVIPWADRIDAFTPPVPYYPGRVAGRGASGAVVVLPEPAAWEFSVTLHGDYSNSHQGLVNRLQALDSFTFDLTLLNLWSIPGPVAVTGSSLRTDTLELIVPVTGIELDHFFVYGGKLMQVAEKLSDRIRAYPRPDVRPALGNLTVPATINVFMPRPPAPVARRGRLEASTSITLRTA